MDTLPCSIAAETPVVVMNRAPRGEILGQHPPGATASYNVHYTVDDFSHIDSARPAARFRRGDQRFDDVPLLVAEVAGVSLGLHVALLQPLSAKVKRSTSIDKHGPKLEDFSHTLLEKTERRNQAAIERLEREIEEAETELETATGKLHACDADVREVAEHVDELPPGIRLPGAVSDFLERKKQERRLEELDAERVAALRECEEVRARLDELRRLKQRGPGMILQPGALADFAAELNERIADAERAEKRARKRLRWAESAVDAARQAC